MIIIGNIKLPLEIISNILERVSQNDQFNLRIVCSQFKEIIDGKYSFFMEGFKIKVCDGRYNFSHFFREIDNDIYKTAITPVSSLRTFKINSLIIGNLIKKEEYDIQDLDLKHPGAVKKLYFKGKILSEYFSRIWRQVSVRNLVELEISKNALSSLNQNEMKSLDNFKSLKKLIIAVYPNSSDLKKVQIFLTENKFPHLKDFEFSLSRKLFWELRSLLETDFQLNRCIIYPFLQNCKNTLENLKIDFQRPEFYNLLIFFNKENLNLEEHKILCPNLKSLKVTFDYFTKTDFWINFFQENLGHLRVLEWNELASGNEDLAKIATIFQEKPSNLEKFKLNGDFLGDLDLQMFSNFPFLKSLVIQTYSLQQSPSLFLNIETLSQICPHLEQIFLSGHKIKSDSIHFLFTAQNFPKLRRVQLFLTGHEGDFGMNVRTLKKIFKEKKFESIKLQHYSLNVDSFLYPNFRKCLTKILGKEDYVKMKELLKEERVDFEFEMILKSEIKLNGETYPDYFINLK